MRTELPEKWYVVRTPENAQELNDWADETCQDATEWDRGVVGYVYYDGYTSGYPRTFTFAIPEITYEEFTKLVLNKNV